MKKIKEIEELLIKTGLKIAKRGEGALFVIGEAEYSPMVEQTVPPFDVIKNPKLLESLALMDGAVIIEENGLMKNYGVMIKSTEVLKNSGTRHSAAASAAKGKTIAVLVSEEDRKVKIFKEGKIIVQLDSLEKDIDKSVSKVVEFLESIGAGTIGTIGLGLIVPGLGLALLPGVIVFGSAYYMGKLLTQKWVENRTSG